MKKRVLWSIGIAALAVFVMAACGNGTTGSSGAIDELLREYMGPQQQRWNDGSINNYAYFLDPARFEAFRAELEATGEYSQTRSWNEPRDFNLGLNYASWNVAQNGEFLLGHSKADNTEFGYGYVKNPQASGTKVDELLRKYMGPQQQIWSEGLVYVYYLDPVRFEAFRSELDATGEYQQDGDSWTENRDWDLGLTFARWSREPDGIFRLALCKADNTVVGYRYTKAAQ